MRLPIPCAGLATAALLLGTTTPLRAEVPFVCGRDFEIHHTRLTPPAAGLQRLTDPVAPPVAGAPGSTAFFLIAGPGLSSNADAHAAFIRAIQLWQSWLDDPVIVTIEGDFASLGANVLGATDMRIFQDSFDVIRGAMITDAGPTESLTAALPTSGQLSVVVPPGWSFAGDAIATKANLRALGFDMSFDEPYADASIIFNSDFAANFDFDSSDGIDSTKYDFEAIVIHEIGHALGFYSQLDIIDVLYGFGLPGGAFITPLDMFRFRPGEGTGDFTLNPRMLGDGTSEPDQVTYDGVLELAMSTGANVGDGYQASHWKDDSLLGSLIGIMDPALPAGLHEELVDNDRRIMGLIGWDLETDCNGNNFPDTREALEGYAPDCNGNNLPDTCDVASGSSLDTNLNGIPDECEALGTGDLGGMRPARLWASPNPLRTSTRIAFSLDSGGSVGLDVFDASGRRVRRLLAADYPAGSHAVAWDARDDAGRRLPAGIYYLRLEGTAIQEIRSLIVLH